MSKINDLRSYIAALEEAGQLARISHPVSIVHELADVAAALERSRGPAPLFEHPQNDEDTDNSFQWRVFSSGVANEERAAIALRCKKEESIDVMGQAQAGSGAIPPRRGADAKWKENVITGADIDVRKLPIPKHSAHDGGRFITGGVMVGKDPATGIGNLSYNRMDIQGPNRMGCNINQWRHLGAFHEVAEAEGKPLDCVMAIGLDPAIMIAAACRYDGDELDIAGAIAGEGVPVAKGVTVDLDVPAEAEVVLEGHLLPGVRQEEGPLAEFHGHYGDRWPSPVFEVTAICHRDDPIFQTIIPGWNEHIYLGNTLTREELLMRFVRHVSKNVTAVHIPPYANGFTVIVQLDKSHPGEARNVALAAFTAHVNFRICVVVDTDVDIYDPADVLWAITSRVEWGDDNAFFVPGSQNHEMDPAADNRGLGTKVGIDATFKGRRGYEKRVRYQPVDLAKYLGMQ